MVIGTGNAPDEGQDKGDPDLVGVGEMIEHDDAHDHLFDGPDEPEKEGGSRFMRVLGDITRMLKP